MCRIADVVRDGAFLHPFIAAGTSMSGHTGMLYIDKNQNTAAGLCPREQLLSQGGEENGEQQKQKER